MRTNIKLGVRNGFGQFISKPQSYAVGDTTIRTRHTRGGVQRAWVKVSEPNTWRLRAVSVWESVHGPVPSNYCVHHIDGNTLNDCASNLSLVSRAEHLALHRAEHTVDRTISSSVARASRFWSTKSNLGKRTGRHPNGCMCDLHKPRSTTHAQDQPE